VESARQTLESTRDAFSKAGLESAWERVIALVVQPGVEFGHGFIQDYERDAAQPLKKWIETQGELTYEAHSTDYQRPEALRQLVEDHFAILKVGPALTFAFREAVFSLTSIEEELAHVERNLSPSNIREVIDVVMRENPEHWKDYYTGSEGELRLARAFSLSDRIRYYWAHPRIQKSLGHLFHNLQEFPPPMTLISQFLPLQYEAIREGFLRKDPRFQVFYKIRQVLKDYAVAARMRSYAIKEF
jgi:D-tagatose-1,6-bisphosphate aldolase subunit GatZ/KbaZ